MLEAMEQGQLVDEDGPECEALRADEAARRDGAVHIEDAFEVLVEVLDGEGAQFVEDAAHLDAVVGVGIGSPAGRHQEAVGGGALLVKSGILVSGVAQDEANGWWQHVQQAWRRLLSAALAGVNSAANGIQTAATVVTRCSFQP